MTTFLEELGIKQWIVILYSDNQSSIYFNKNTSSHSRSKHIDVRYHYIRECVRNNLVDLYYIQTDKQAADILTKNLLNVTFTKMLTLCGIHIK